MYMLRAPQRVHLDVGQVLPRLRWVLGQVALVLLGVLVYFGVRGLTEGSTSLAREHAYDIVDLERALGIDVEAELQRLVAPSETMQTVANWIYIWGHWPAIIATMIWLVWLHRDVFLLLRDAMMVSGLLGMVVFVSYPVAPPRLAHLGLVDTVTEQSRAYRVLQPPAFVNQYAAMPSLHSGWDLLVGLAIIAAASSVALRIVGFAMPVLMAFAVVATANHYIVDVVAGVALALVGHAVALHLEQRRRRRRSRPRHPLRQSRGD
ncbi:MAG: phosphatase PAP2 family protein [Marmoricola sp.]